MAKVNGSDLLAAYVFWLGKRKHNCFLFDKWLCDELLTEEGLRRFLKPRKKELADFISNLY